MISLIVAHDEKLCIGKDGWMPWQLKEDLKRFKEKTLHQHIVMGRTTFEALKKPLPQRTTYVITHQPLHYEAEHVHVDVYKRQILCRANYQISPRLRQRSSTARSAML